jgi:hypothetical protein
MVPASLRLARASWAAVSLAAVGTMAVTIAE